MNESKIKQNFLQMKECKQNTLMFETLCYFAIKPKTKQVLVTQTRIKCYILLWVGNISLDATSANNNRYHAKIGMIKDLATKSNNIGLTTVGKFIPNKTLIYI